MTLAELYRVTARKLRVVSFCSIICFPMDCTDIGRAIESLGFQQINPPSTAAGPGSMVYIKQEHPLRIGMICSTRHSLGSHFAPREHPTSQATFNKTRNRHFALSADVMSQVKADVSLHAIKSVCVTLSNPKIYMVEDTDVHYNIQYRSEICTNSIARRVASNFRVSMISETLEGDVTYSVTWDSAQNLTAQAKLEILSNLRAKLRLGTAQIVGNAIVGKSLVWGIVDDRWLAQASIDGAFESYIPGVISNSPQVRTIGPYEHPVEVDPRPEIPMRDSTNPENQRYR